MAVETVEGANATSVTLGTPATADTLTPPVNDGFNRIDPSVDNVSDIDGPVKGGETKSAEDLAKETEAKAAEKADQARFDKHPRFQELIKERDTMKLELATMKGRLDVLTPQQQAKVETREDKGLPYKDITQMKKEELLEWQEDDPVGYAANLYQQMLHETRETIKREQAEASTTTSIKGTYAAYEKENADFRAKWDSGELMAYMNAHPGHNAISAHQVLTAESRKGDLQKQIDAAVQKAVKDAEERVKKNFQAKRNAEVIGDGGSIKTGEIPDELKHPDKYGGVTATLAARLSRLRQAAAGG